MLAPERRTRLDVAVAAIIAIVVAIAAAVIWIRSDARGTTSITSDTPAAEVDTALSPPESLDEIWRADSPETTAPLVAAGVVATADGGTVTGRDRLTGAELWRYQRDMPLCGAIGAWNTVVAVYRDQRGCSQVTQLDGATGERKAQRSSDADDEVTLSYDGTYVVSRGSERMELWRSDLVRTLEFGRVDAPINPGKQPHPGCELRSAAAGGTRVSVLMDCPGEAADRLSVLDAAPKDNQEPQEFGTILLTGPGSDSPGARLIAASGDHTAVYLPAGPVSGPRYAVHDGTGNEVASYPVTGEVSPHATAARNGSVFTWWTGSELIALSTSELAPRWTFPGALGPGAIMAGSLLVPVPGGIAVLDPATGVEQRRIPVTRDSDAVPIATAVVGDVVLEQRGGEVVALR
ncbi:Rv3212 family protein [Rhodococcus sp. AG1013]|uniref:Rv3212 family protein n=1 Tax=unclassified Rhodococcus (in: high G+C Gram-positive bacteria) TaxID=192944 RepID=UPI000E0B6E13|nr:PQQ-binding-like beta-propeller repeat protein [Rhodococcus sp. AG1013]RDI25794.1 putative pyrroloquinoline-quinone binding quinoprotein [Rhodococcus sp. AG1013]